MKHFNPLFFCFFSRLSIIRFFLFKNHTEVMNRTVVNCRWFEMFVHCKCWQVASFVISIGFRIFYVEYHYIHIHTAYTLYICKSWLARWYSNHSNMIQIHMSRKEFRCRVNWNTLEMTSHSHEYVNIRVTVCVCVSSSHIIYSQTV